MTVAAELQKGSQLLEYFVTIEGVGWPVNGIGGALSGGFDGDIFTTNDINGDLQTQLQGSSLTVHKGLELPSSVSESIDPRTVAYNPSGISFEIIDVDDFLVGTITPRRSGATTELELELKWGNVNPRLTNGAAFDTGDLVWVGGTELIKLGTKTLVAGSVYDYLASSRGYLGTRRGSAQRRPEDYCQGHWPAETTVYTIPWWWFNRKVAVWAHVPGEPAANCSLRWFGKLRPIKNPMAGITYSFDAAGDFISSYTRVRRAIDWQVKNSRAVISRAFGSMPEDFSVTLSSSVKREIEFSIPNDSRIGDDGSGLYELAAAYIYRNVPGGLEGMVSSFTETTVQARDIGTETDAIYSFVWAGESAYLMYSRQLSDSNANPKLIRGQIVPAAGENVMAGLDTLEFNARSIANGETYNLGLASGAPARFLLDNLQKGKYKGRFNLWGNARANVQHSRHPIDVALMFLCSMDRELNRMNTVGGSTSTVIQVASTGFNDDDVIGKALFMLEGNGGVGTAPEMEACTITDNDSTSFTLDGGFSAAPNALLEVQIRNTVYDVLPLGWGMGIDSNDIDVESFERVRDEDIPDVELGDFILGVEDEIDIWDMLYENIFKPYGILVYFDYELRKIAARYVGVTPTDGVFDAFVAIDREDIIENGNITHVFNNPINQINLTVRKTEKRLVGFGATNVDKQNTIVSQPIHESRAALQNGETTTIKIKSDELNNAFSEHWLDQLDISALLNTDSDFTPLAGRLLGMVGEYSVPPPVWDTILDVGLYQDLKPGVYVIINWNEHNAPVNPFTGNRGWTDIVGRVIKRSYPLDNQPAFNVTIELLTANLTARLAPAVIVTGKGSDGLGAYFTCDETAAGQNYVADPDANKDFHYFAVGDEIEHRDETGAIKASWTDRSITGFGTNEQADPTTAPGSPMRIYVDGVIGSTVAAGDYITFTDWQASVSSRRSRYSTYADSNEELGPDNDPARVFA